MANARSTMRTLKVLSMGSTVYGMDDSGKPYPNKSFNSGYLATNHVECLNGSIL